MRNLLAEAKKKKTNQMDSHFKRSLLKSQKKRSTTVFPFCPGCRTNCTEVNRNFIRLLEVVDNLDKVV